MKSTHQFKTTIEILDFEVDFLITYSVNETTTAFTVDSIAMLSGDMELYCSPWLKELFSKSDLIGQDIADRIRAM